ncbi:MAG: hypothetical protein KIS87_06640 [Phycisphaeraceae bacterium]|nr:hypothetical protein [Phycisphaeraceae bacterium]
MTATPLITKFERRGVASSGLYGVVVDESRSLVLVHETIEFRFDGYAVIRRKDITKRRASDYEACFETIMRKEGLWKRPTRFVRSLPLASWTALLKRLMGRHVIIENERQEDFWIGPVVACDDRSVSIHDFDAKGEWQSIVRVPNRSITCVKFGTSYIETFRRHLPPRPRA